VLGLARFALEHIYWHLFVLRAFLCEQHPNCPDIRTAVKTVENDPSHFIPFAWTSLQLLAFGVSPIRQFR
jgi:hypothetical protein